jgi:glycosyltransferase involved in cell wall biosynthesis
MQESKSQPLLVHLTNIPTPYRIVFCNALQKALADFGLSLHVFYCAEREFNRDWNIPFEEMHYPYEVLPGISPRVGNVQFHCNPIIILRLRHLRPQILLMAGSWNMPTALLASQPLLCGRIFRVFWNEGQADAVLHPNGPIAWMRRLCLRAYNAFAVPNESSARFVETELGFRPIILPLPNTVDAEFYRLAREMDKRQVRRELNLPLDATVFVSVARLDEGKGVRELVSAMGQLQVNQRSVLVLVGGGPLYAELEETVRLANLDVRLVGSQRAAGVRAYLAAADAFVLASKRDSNPLAVIEAAFAGLPLLVSHKAGNVRELVHEGASGMVIPSVDSGTIAAVLTRFCQLGEAERRQLADGAARLAETGFCPEGVARNFVAALLEHWRGH